MGGREEKYRRIGPSPVRSSAEGVPKTGGRKREREGRVSEGGREEKYRRIGSSPVRSSAEGVPRTREGGRGGGRG